MIALACSPALCANAEMPTYGCRDAGGKLVTSATAWATRVASRSRPVRQDLTAELELEVGDHADEVGVAGAFAVPVEGALDVGGAGVDRGQRVRDRAAGVVVAVDADAHAGRLDHVVHDVCHPAGQHAAVGVAQGGHLGAGSEGGAQHLERVVAVGAVAVEEVLGVQEHPLPLGPQVRDGVLHHREVLLQRRTQCQLDVAVVRLRDEGDHTGTGVAQRGDQRVVGRLHAGAPGGSEGRELRVLEVQLLARAAEEVGVLRVRARPATLDETHAQVVDLPRNRQLVRDGEVQPLLLRTVAQGGVVDVEQVAGHGPCSLFPRVLLRHREMKRPPVGTRGQRGGSVRPSPSR